MADSRRLQHAGAVADLWEALTAHGLSGAQSLPPVARSLAAPGAQAPTVALGWRAGRPAALHAAGQRKGTVMKAVARFLDWWNSRIAQHERTRDEAYLAQASDHCDLEHRVRELERESSVVRNWW